MKTRCQTTKQDIYALYREVLKRPDLTKSQIDRMRVRIRMIAEATLDYLSSIQK